jgi:23S rRNA (uracil1939-C5)-methyltransferase
LKELALEPGQVVELQIERLAPGGNGVARHNGLVVFVPLTAPGDRIKASAEIVKKNFVVASLLEILEPGPTRREAPCPYYGICGGCNWQHVTYGEQLRQKQNQVERLALKANPEVELLFIEPSPSEWRYRSRVQIHSENKKAGFLKRGSDGLVDIKDCLITDPRVTANFENVRQESLKQRQKFELGVTDQGETYQINLEEDDYTFTQVNRAQNQKLVDDVVNQVGDSEFILDLYCGSGNFTVPLAQKLPKSRIVGVEESKKSIELAKQQSSGQPNLQFVAQESLQYLRKLPTLEGATVILDPPRAGCDDHVLRQLCEKGAYKIVYVSCNPATAARDWQFVTGRFQLVRVKPFDMFPQTDHVELVSTLVSREPSDPVRLESST